ncbi:flagellar hook-length control protein FliK [Devosia sp.]|uniref:flagellar hook-length control protein FliK n=1 Tax=Devosia sp. TaxID=1871048 RepID=UPI0035AD874C
MSTSVSVGFSPATSPQLSTGVIAERQAASGGADTGLFAALLSLLGNQLTEAAGEAGIALPKELADNPLLASLTAVATELPELAAADPSALPDGLGKVDGEAANTLIRDLAAALTALSDALATGRPIDPALEDKLGDTLDAVAALLGIPLPPQQPTAAGPAAPDGVSQVSATTPVGTTPAADGSGAAPAETPDTPAPAGMQARPVPEILARLGGALTDLATRLEAQAPALSRALAGLGERLSVGDVPDAVLAAMGVPREGETTNRDLLQLVASLAPRPATPTLPPTQPIAAPSLEPVGLATSADDATDAQVDDGATAAPRLAPAPDARPDDKPAPEAKAGLTVRPADQPAPAAATVDPATATVPGQAGAIAAPTARAIHAAYQAPVQQLNLPQVAFELARHVEAGNSRFQIRLDPPELGRIDVRLDLDGSGTVNARLVVERSETLDLMQRDQRALQQALQQAGLDAGKTNLEFSLRQNPFARDFGDGAGGDRHSGSAGPSPGAGVETVEAAVPASVYRGTASAGGVNLFV